ncbi:MAG: nucleotide exchange factor GrpE [Alphaproteobacteria bacterium]|nr:MAG: nucleotide exchange factor GrpE [Alphaproteobacteria bacterium]
MTTQGARPKEQNEAETDSGPAEGQAAGGAAEGAAEGTAETALDPREAEILSLTVERDELKDRLLRALAEAENARKRAERDRRDAENFGATRLARDLLTVHDSLVRALESVDDRQRAEMGAFIEGIELTHRELLNAFARNRIEAVRPQPGDRFDPNLHQAMFEVPAPGAEPGTIVQVINEGFTIAGRLLRAAQVGVAAAAPAASDEPAEAGQAEDTPPA